jgi:hypothetical protein|tara:strand:+ start:489 stop:848 length:360 start_codon:yes stop_codon:yes gene_type:complete
MGFIQMKLPKRMRVKLADTKRKREAQAEHKAWLESQGLDDKSLKRRAKDFKGYNIPDYTPDPNQPKCGDKIPVNSGGKKEPMVYNGERKLIGIGLMHKSNLVPIWDEEGAKEISTMRRN